ncbi:MAG: UDP-N-acetylmuramoyl-tripeptide--D-alanyl-D-alanine ligase, partial [Gammaproteobacteria bacterium]
MNTRQLSQVATAVGGKLIGNDAAFAGVSTDTRKLAKGDLFVAITGATYDAHNFLPVAQERGAAGALVQRQNSGCSLPQIVVSDTR